MEELMPKKSISEFPEVIVSSKDITKEISTYVKQGKLKKLASRVYTTNLSDDPALIVKRNIWQIVAQLFPDGLIADRTALENQPASDGSIFLISHKKREVKISDFIIRPRKGFAPLSTDLPFIGGLHISSQARAFLENMKPSRSRDGKISRTLTQEEVEVRLEKIYRGGGEKALNELRDQARSISKDLHSEEEFKTLNNLIGSLIGTQNHALKSSVGIARRAGIPYDPGRIELFETLFVTLKKTAPLLRLLDNRTSEELINLSFFEAYFSNFIEGTEFEIGEAFNIIFKNQIPQDRPEDAHDILGTFKVVSSLEEMKKTPSDFDDFIYLLKKRHNIIMEGRSDKNPGHFKKSLNRAGNTVFVEPDLVMGTFQKGFEFYQSLETPLHRAIFMMFLVSEVHPFSDGNGRVARVMMNAELEYAGEIRILIPIVYRNNYLSSLKALSLNKRAEPLIRVLDFAQNYTSRIDFTTFKKAQRDLIETNAFVDPNIADHEGKKLVLLS